MFISLPSYFIFTTFTTKMFDKTLNLQLCGLFVSLLALLAPADYDHITQVNVSTFFQILV